MRAVDRTTKMFLQSLREAVPGASVGVSRSKTAFGRSNYVFIRRAYPLAALKIRISDHPVGMRRALSGGEDLYITAGARPDSWAVWLGAICCRHGVVAAGQSVAPQSSSDGSPRVSGVVSSQTCPAGEQSSAGPFSAQELLWSDFTERD